MKQAYLFILLLLPASVHASDDRITQSIKNVDPVYLHQLLMPGFYIRADDKKRYLALAQEMTNQTYAELHSLSLADIARFVQGSFSFACTSLCAYAGYKYYKQLWDISTFEDVPDDNVPHVVQQRLIEKGKRLSLYTGLGCAAVYCLYKGFRAFSALVNKEHRYYRHRDALAVEAIIQRLMSEA